MSTGHLPALLDRVRSVGLLVGIAGLVLCGVGMAMDREQFFRSYLIGYLFWAGIAIGCVPLLLLHNLVGGAWGAAVRRPAEAGALTIPLIAVFFLPIALGVETLYAWTRSSEMAHHAILQNKKAFLNLPAFFGRTAIYFAFWTLIVVIVTRLSRARDPRALERGKNLLGIISGPALLLHVLAVTFASVDWIMSLEPEWYSTVFGPMWMTGQTLTAFALLIMVVAPRVGSDEAETLNDLGNLLLAFVMLWAYMHFSQFLIIWSGNLKEEIPWYLSRTRHGWEIPAVALIIFMFVLPFLVLLNRDVKRRGDRLARLASVIVVMDLVATFWIVAPSFYPRGLRVHWLDFASVAGIGGIWVAAFLWLLGRAPLGFSTKGEPNSHAGGD